MQIPFLDLQAHHDPIRDKLMATIGEVIDSAAFAGGPFVAKFEQEFAAYCRSSFAIGVGNGTDALYLILRAMGIRTGDEVILPVNTFIATAEAVNMTGAKPVA